MTEKRHILLIENSENDIEFFRDALEESGLGFLFSTARNVQQAFTILNSSMADMIFMNVHLVIDHNIVAAKKLKSLYSSPVVFYSNVQSRQIQKGLPENLNYVQLPGSIESMGRILRNLLAGTKTQHEPEVLVEN